MKVRFSELDTFLAEADAVLAQGAAVGREGVIGLIVVRPDGRVFAQRRSPNRKTFPGCWDLVGGHVEPGESARPALERELAEETGWELADILAVHRVVDWETESNGKTVLKREVVLAITITGGWDSPRLEAGKVSEGRWFGPDDLATLNEGREGGDAYVHDLVRDWYER